MNCAGCGHENRAGARFCEECAAPLKRVCASCGAELRPAAKFCDECATPTSPRPTAVAATRKVVTIVFADLVGSTSLHERLDAESARRFMESYYRAMRGAVDAHGGTVTQLLGDGVKAVFGIPRVAEDDAIRAVRAAVEMQRAFRALAEQQAGAVGKTGLRVAVNTGEVVANDASEIIGDPVNVAARLQEQGRDGDVVVGDSTQRLVADRVTLEPLGSFALKGRTEAVSAYRVVSLERPAGAAATAFVGRDTELARIRAVYQTAIDKPAACLAVLLGSPGLGKSRLIDEFVRRLGEEATVLLAQCDAAGGASFAPLAVAMRQSLGIEASASGDALRASLEAALPGGEAERARIVTGIAALLAGSPASPEETFFVVRRLLAALAATRPVVLVIDDLHWAEPLLLDLVEHLVQWGSGVPLLVLVGARPEMRDVRSSLATPGGLVADVITLSGLDAGAAMRLAANVIGAADLPSAVAVKVLTASEGNPLFVGELVRMLVHEGALKREGDRWTTGTALAALEMPPTIQALLAARIERLRPEERGVLERAAIVGRYFSRSAVAELLPRDVSDLDARLESLRRSELVERDTGWFLGEPVLRFHHVLIRDAAYRRVLKETRAELHARLADWIEARAGVAIEHDETIGWHLEQAHQHLRELGPIDEKGSELGERAARRLGAAGRRALARDDLPLAASLLGRAVGALDPADSGRADLALDWCEALLAAGDVSPAATAVEELGRFTADSARLCAWHTCFAGQLRVLTAPEGLSETADAVSAAATELATLGDSAGEAKAHFVYALALARLGKFGGCEAALDHALAAARRADDQRRANTVLAIAPLAALWGPSPVTRASGRCLDVVRVLRITQSAPAVEAVALSCQGVLEALRGRTDAARRMIASSRKMVEELGITHRLLEADVFAGQVELLEGEAASAERRLRPAFEGLRELGLGIDAARAAALLARALLALGQVAEAEALSHESEALAGDDLKAAIAWRGVRAEALARRGEHIAAVELASQAVEIASATDALLDHADARLALAAALRAAGRGREADAEERRATVLWEAKGATLLAERARSEVARVEPVAPTPEARSQPAPSARRRMRANAATTCNERFIEGVETRDADAIAALVAPDAEFFHHPTGTAYGRDGSLTLLGQLIGARDLAFRSESIGALGESLALFHETVSFSDLDDDALGPFGAVERERFGMVEVDASGRQRRVEFFATDHLSVAVARLYERHAELLPEGPARDRAMTTAHAVEAMLIAATDPDRLATAFAPSVEFADLRSIGLGSVDGADDLLRAVRSHSELTVGVALCVDDVLCLRSDALLVRRTDAGTLRSSGGVYERQMLVLLVFGLEGLLTRWENFDVDRESDALARFDEPTARAPAPAVRRPVRPNAATDAVARLDAVIDARDEEALAALLDDSYELIDHQNSATWGATESAATARKFMRSIDASLAHEPIATLGESLALSRRARSARGAVGGRFDVGEYEHEDFALDEVSAGGLIRRIELFSTDHLGDAIVSLYERYANLLPDGPERERAAATTRSVTAALGPYDPDRYTVMHAPTIEYFDHRMPGVGALSGAQAVRHWFSSLLEVAVDVTNRFDHILALCADGLLLRWTNLGTERASGGSFERHFLWLAVFGAGGLMTHIELFDVDREAEALARFDELTARPPAPAVRRHVRPNAATALWARYDAAFAARDSDAIAALYGDAYEEIHHPTGTSWDRDGAVATAYGLWGSQDVELRHETLATLGEPLGLCRCVIAASGMRGGRFDVAAFEREEIEVVEIDEHGRLRCSEIFAAERLGEAIARLYARHAELLRDGADRDRAAATARSVATLPGSPDRWPFARDAEARDYRIVGFGSLRGAEAVVRAIRALLELTDDWAIRVDDVLGLRSDALFVRWTTSGALRAGGGAFERLGQMIWLFGTDGLLVRWEQFDVGQEAEARARFDELTAETPHVRPLLRRVRQNAATAHTSRLDAAVAGRDVDALLALFADDVEIMDHITHTTWDRKAVSSSWRSLARAENPACRHEPLATLGDSLALSRMSLSASRLARGNFDVGGYEKTEIRLCEVDAQGRLRRGEVFAVDKFGDALVRFYERYAELLSDAAARDRAVATARSVAAMVNPPEIDRLAEAFAPQIETTDDQTLGSWSARGAEAVLAHFRSLLEVASEIVFRDYEILGLEPRVLLVRRTVCGTQLAYGGTWEGPFLMLLAVGDDGQLTRIHWFDVDREAEALARFQELSEATSPFATFANTASRVHKESLAAFESRDWTRYRKLMCEGFRFVDRSRVAQLELDRDRRLAYVRSIGEMSSIRAASRLLATRGERLALAHLHLEVAGGDVGPSEIDALFLTETNDRGEMVFEARFGGDDVDVAYAELDARYEADEAAAHSTLSAAVRARTSAFSRRDWEAFDAIYGPEFVYNDHRLLGFGEIRGGKGYTRLMQSLVDLAPDSQFREDHVRRSDRGQLAQGTRLGTRDGGAYEAPRISVIELDRRGEFRRLDVYDVDQLDQARARFAEPSTAASPPAAFANAATRALDRGTAALAARNWEGFAALFAADYRNFDRRPLMRLETDREQWLASFRQIVEMTSSPPPHEVLATRGDRLALVRVLWRGAAGDVGPSDIDWLLIIEVNERGDHRVVVVYEPGDLDAAYAELDARYKAGEGKEHSRLSSAMSAVRRAFESRNWEELEALYSPDFVMQDHSLLGVGEIRGPNAYVNWLRSLFELAPDARFRHDHVRRSARGQLSRETRLATRDGGAFEKPQINVQELDERGKLSRLDGYDPEQLDQALARFAEIRARATTSAATRFANAATRIVARVDTCWRNRDWEGYAQLCTAGFRYLDRRRIAQLELDRDRFIEFIRQIGDMESSRIDFDVLATRGDRLALVRSLTEFSDADLGRSEIDSVLLIETDDRGEMLAMVRFDADDLDAAYIELDARFEAGEGALHSVASITMRAVGRGWQRRDGRALAALCAPDLVFQDHRQLGFGELVRDPAQWVRTQQALFDLAPDARGRFHHVRLSDRAHLIDLTVYGTREGGAFEIPQIAVRELDGLGQITRMDVFDPGQLDEAFARFAEIGSRSAPDPLRIPPNAATRAVDLLDSLIEAGDWEALGTLCAPIAYEDRRALIRAAGGCEVFIASCRYTRTIGVKPLHNPLATLGDRLALHRDVWRLVDDGQLAEVETLQLIEVDVDGRVTAIVVFGAEDRAAASAELFERYARSGADGSPAALLEFVRRWNDHDVDGMRAILPEDFFIRDHRRTGVGRIENREAYLASVVALFELSRDVRLESLHLIAAAPHGRVDVQRWFGANAEGGAFEAIFIRLWLYRGERPVGIELFEVEDRDAALARFEALRPDPLSIPPNAATRTIARVFEAFRARDWALYRELAADGFCWEDRGRRALIRGDVEMWISSAKFRSDVPGGRAEVETLGTVGERLMVDRLVWTGGPDGAEFENVRIRVVEVDDTGRLRAMILYDIEDRGAAFAEALARFASGEAAACPGLAAVAQFIGGFSAHDWDRVSEVMAPDWVFDDHRTIGMGTLDRERHIASMRAHAEIGPGLAADVRHVHAWNRHGLVVEARTHGTVRDGGPFENVFIGLFLVAGQHVTRHETFNLADLERALARFEELSR